MTRGGTLLLAADPGTTTLYLGDEEISLNTSTGAVTGTRYYTRGGVTVVSRTGASAIAYLAGNSQGTSTVAVDAVTLTATRRWYDPYGNPRGNIPSSFPDGQKAFVGGTADAATGLTNLGIREYQPSLGAFISADPVLKPYEPTDLNPYAYAKGNPATNSDPSGAATCPVDASCTAAMAAFHIKIQQLQAIFERFMAASWNRHAARGDYTVPIGYNSPVPPPGGYTGADVPTVVNDPTDFNGGVADLTIDKRWKQLVRDMKEYFTGLRNKTTMAASVITVDGHPQIIATINNKGSLPKYMTRILNSLGAEAVPRYGARGPRRDGA